MTCYGGSHCFGFIDDILMFSNSMEEHVKDLAEILNRLDHYGFILNQGVFSVNEVNFLGYRVDSQGVRPLVTKVSAIRDFSKPKTIQDLRKFFGAIKFYRRFIPNAGGLLQPLD